MVDIIFSIGFIITIIFNIYIYALLVASNKIEPYTDIEDYEIFEWFIVFLGFFVALFIALFWPIELIFIGFKNLVMYIKNKIKE